MRHPSKQCSVLKVGVRIRKTVPEGCKLSCGLPNHYKNLTPERNSVTQPRSFTSLFPRCGAPEIRYYNPQPAPCEEASSFLQINGDDYRFLPTQESKASFDATPPVVTVTVASSHKRRCEDDDDDLDMESGPAYPRSYPPFSHTRMPNLDQLGPIGVHKTRKKPGLDSSESKESEMIDVVDVREAEFFRPTGGKRTEVMRMRHER